jgi:hypothetical protein
MHKKTTTSPKSEISSDYDNDGVPDNYDKCPDIKGSVNNMGCYMMNGKRERRK